MPQKNKPRLYIALCSRVDTSFRDEVDWTRLGHDTTCAMIEKLSFYEEQDMDVSLAQTIMVKITLAKVTSIAQLQKTLRGLPMPEDDPTWTCLSWVRLALQKLVTDRKAVKTYVTGDDWADIEARTRRYVQEKREQRRALDLSSIPHSIPTWNFWENRETHQ